MNQIQFPVPVSAGDLNQFIQSANQAPYLSYEEERSLAIRLRDNNDLDAARQLVMSHLRYVVHVARSYVGYGLPLADLIQEGTIGLMKAVNRFDVTRGVRLVSFAAHWIRAEIHEFVLKNWNIVKVATTKAQRKLFFNLRSQKENLGPLGLPEAADIAERLGVGTDDVLEMDARLSERNLSFERSSDADDEDSMVPADYLSVEGDNPEYLMEEEEWESHQHQALSRALAKLDDRSRDILESRWLAEQKTGLKELGEKYAVSAERIRQLENQALKKLQVELGGV